MPARLHRHFDTPNIELVQCARPVLDIEGRPEAKNGRNLPNWMQSTAEVSGSTPRHRHPRKLISGIIMKNVLDLQFSKHFHSH
jgi:hypothetical protein